MTSKPFIARGSRIERCTDCLLAKKACICAFKITYPAKAEFLLLMHHDERFKPTNTGRLIEDCIADTQRFIWSRTEPSNELLAVLADQRYDPYIVFPEGKSYSHRMTPYSNKQGKTPLFIILDGTWRQAGRMFRLSQYLEHIPVIQPNVQKVSSYKLRKAPIPGQLCTVEVAAEMLNCVGDNKGGDLLSAYFEVFNDHYKASRVNRSLDEQMPAKLLLKAFQQISFRVEK